MIKVNLPVDFRDLELLRSIAQAPKGRKGLHRIAGNLERDIDTATATHNLEQFKQGLRNIREALGEVEA